MATTLSQSQLTTIKNNSNSVFATLCLSVDLNIIMVGVCPSKTTGHILG